jgi:hypothetical protein
VEEATPLRSLRAQSEREGAKLQAHIGVKSAAILAAHGVGKAEGAEVQEPRFGVQEGTQKAVAEVTAALTACTEDAEARAEMAANPVPYEEPGRSVNIAVDEVGVKRQKATRKTGGGSGGGQKRGEKVCAHDGSAYRHRSGQLCVEWLGSGGVAEANAGLSAG